MIYLNKLRNYLRRSIKGRSGSSSFGRSRKLLTKTLKQRLEDLEKVRR
jgi:hypothetical protein